MFSLLLVRAPPPCPPQVEEDPTILDETSLGVASFSPSLPFDVFSRPLSQTILPLQRLAELVLRGISCMYS